MLWRQCPTPLRLGIVVMINTNRSTERTDDNDNYSEHYSSTYNRGKWGKVMTRGKMVIRSVGFNIQMASFDKYQKLVLPLDIF